MTSTSLNRVSLSPQPSALKKHHHRAAAAIGLARLAERQYFVPVYQPGAQFALEHRLAVF